MTNVERLLLESLKVAFGSGHDGHLFEFIAGKPSLSFRFPEAAIRQ